MSRPVLSQPCGWPFTAHLGIRMMCRASCPGWDLAKYLMSLAIRSRPTMLYRVERLHMTWLLHSRQACLEVLDSHVLFALLHRAQGIHPTRRHLGRKLLALGLRSATVPSDGDQDWTDEMHVSARTDINTDSFTICSILAS